MASAQARVPFRVLQKVLAQAGVLITGHVGYNESFATGLLPQTLNQASITVLLQVGKGLLICTSYCAIRPRYVWSTNVTPPTSTCGLCFLLNAVQQSCSYSFTKMSAVLLCEYHVSNFGFVCWVCVRLMKRTERGGSLFVALAYECRSKWVCVTIWWRKRRNVSCVCLHTLLREWCIHDFRKVASSHVHSLEMYSKRDLKALVHPKAKWFP